MNQNSPRPTVEIRGVSQAGNTGGNAPAPIINRFLAQVVDTVALHILYVAVKSIPGLFAGAASGNFTYNVMLFYTGLAKGSERLSGTLFSIVAMVVVVYLYSAHPLAKSGSTPGKKLFKIRVTDRMSTEQPGILRAFFREYTKALVGSFFLPVSALFLFVTRGRESLSDLLFRTRVVEGAAFSPPFQQPALSTKQSAGSALARVLSLVLGIGLVIAGIYVGFFLLILTVPGSREYIGTWLISGVMANPGTYLVLTGLFFIYRAFLSRGTGPKSPNVSGPIRPNHLKAISLAVGLGLACFYYVSNKTINRDRGPSSARTNWARGSLTKGEVIEKYILEKFPSSREVQDVLWLLAENFQYAERTMSRNREQAIEALQELRNTLQCVEYYFEKSGESDPTALAHSIATEIENMKVPDWFRPEYSKLKTQYWGETREPNFDSQQVCPVSIRKYEPFRWSKARSTAPDIALSEEERKKVFTQDLSIDEDFHSSPCSDFDGLTTPGAIHQSKFSSYGAFRSALFNMAKACNKLSAGAQLERASVYVRQCKSLSPSASKVTFGYRCIEGSPQANSPSTAQSPSPTDSDR